MFGVYTRIMANNTPVACNIRSTYRLLAVLRAKYYRESILVETQRGGSCEKFYHSSRASRDERQTRYTAGHNAQNLAANTPRYADDDDDVHLPTTYFPKRQIVVFALSYQPEFVFVRRIPFE